MKTSQFGQRLGADAGIVQLMDDLGDAMAVNEDMLMLGGGNPGRIPQMQEVFRSQMQRLLGNGDAFDRLVGNYGPPKGDPCFIHSLAELLRSRFGFDVGPEHIALTNGSQSASFMIFNILAGANHDGVTRKVMFPLVPEYIGYTDQAISPTTFVSTRPEIERHGERRFKYRVDFDRLTLDDSIGLICASRPTNPTGNVLTDGEIAKLRALAREHRIALMIDNAYGTPFPGIVFAAATPVWDESMIMCMSLSKIGLPGVRTGIVVAHPDLIKALSATNAVINLTTSCFGPALIEPLIANGEILNLSEQVIRPFYQRKANAAMAILDQELAQYPVRIHLAEGAIFLWCWFEDLPISTSELYQRLKARNVLIIPGEHFFPGIDEHWQHSHECVRITYSQDDATVEEGLRRLAAEVRNAYDFGTSKRQN